MAQVAPTSGPAYTSPLSGACPPINPVVGGQVASPGQTAHYEKRSVLIVCQYCQATVTTSLKYAVGMYTWTFVVLFLLIGLSLGCCLIPFCIDSVKDVVHSCPNCHQTVGRYNNHM